MNNWTDHISEDQGVHFKCDHCKASSKLYCESRTEVFTCPSCGKIYSKTKDAYNNLKLAHVNKHAYCFPLYSKCTFDGIEYTVIGEASKYEKGDRFAKWQEYILLDKTNKFAFLNVSYGHWVFLKECTKPANFNSSSKEPFTNDDGNTYKIFSAYYQVTETCLGEFPYDVIDVKTRYTKEFICPPYIFTCETYQNKDSYYQGEYKTQKQIEAAFPGQTLALPPQEGTGSCQPSKLRFDHTNFLKLTFVFFVLGYFLYYAYSYTQNPKRLTWNRIDLGDTLKQGNAVTMPFTLANTSLLRFDSRSGIDNDWLEANITLVNEKTGEERTFVSGHEYYHGQDSDGYWSEGSVFNQDYLNAIEPGTYHAEIQALTSDKRSYRNLEVEIYKDFPSKRNFWLLISSLGVITFLVYYFGNNFEKQRYGTVNNE